MAALEGVARRRNRGRFVAGSRRWRRCRRRVARAARRPNRAGPGCPAWRDCRCVRTRFFARTLKFANTASVSREANLGTALFVVSSGSHLAACKTLESLVASFACDVLRGMPPRAFVDSLRSTLRCCPLQACCLGLHLRHQQAAPATPELCNSAVHNKCATSAVQRSMRRTLIAVLRAPATRSPARPHRRNSVARPSAPAAAMASRSRKWSPGAKIAQLKKMDDTKSWRHRHRRQLGTRVARARTRARPVRQIRRGRAD